nr:hypothetical protein [Spirochaetaceae bacterium]
MNFVDQKTINELHILRKDSSPISLLSILDRTVTTQGTQKLVNHLQNPFQSTEEIEMFQKFITSIIDNLDYWIPFNELLSSKLYKEILHLKKARLVYEEPIYPYDIPLLTSKRKRKRLLYNFLNEIDKTCVAIIHNLETPRIIHKLSKSLSSFTRNIKNKKISD